MNLMPSCFHLESQGKRIGLCVLLVISGLAVGTADAGVCEGTDPAVPDNACHLFNEGECENTGNRCVTSAGCELGICAGGSGMACTNNNDCTQPEICQDDGFCGIRSGTPCTTNADCTVTYTRGDNVILTETCQAGGFCGVSCHRTYEAPAPITPSGFCPTAPGATCVGFEECILLDCPQLVCSDDFIACADDGGCAQGICLVGGGPCHRDTDCPPGNCSVAPSQYCRDDDECPTPFITCTNPDFETCVGGASCNPQQCVVGVPQIAPLPHDRRKNRYISFDPNNTMNDGDYIAFRLELLGIELGSCDGNGEPCRVDRGGDDCNAGQICVNDRPDAGGTNVGHVWWVGPESPRGKSVHHVVSEAFRKVSDDWANPVHVGDCEIVPRAAYGVRAFDTFMQQESAELVVETTQFPPAAPPEPFWWGDVVGAFGFPWPPPNGLVNFDDAVAMSYGANPGVISPRPHVTWVDLVGNVTGDPAHDPPDYVVTEADDLEVFFGAFAGLPYPYSDPVDCPAFAFSNAPLPAPFPHDRRKNRYISFDPYKSVNDGNNIAFNLELLNIELGSCDGNGEPCRVDRGADDCDAGQICVNDHPDAGGTNVGHVWWVGPVHIVIPPNPSLHLVVTEPFRMVSTDWPNPTHVGDCEIVPRARYGVRAFDVDDFIESDELVVETTQFPAVPPPAPFWRGDAVGTLKKHCDGDTREPLCETVADCPPGATTCERVWSLPDGVVNFDDVTAALWTWTPEPGVTVAADITWVDIHGNESFLPGSEAYDPPNYVINVSDLQQFIFAFDGRAYDYYDPADCP